jgi:hypothetical protein
MLSRVHTNEQDEGQRRSSRIVNAARSNDGDWFAIMLQNKKGPARGATSSLPILTGESVLCEFRIAYRQDRAVLLAVPGLYYH